MGAGAGFAVRSWPVHRGGALGILEDQMTSWEPGDAIPDRLDALVSACTELSEGGESTLILDASHSWGHL